MKLAADPALRPGSPRPLSRLGLAVRSALSELAGSNGLPVFLTTAALVYEVFLLLVIFAPAGWGAWSSFAEEFKIWCFRYDPRTGGMEWMAVAIMLAEPIFIIGLLLFVWRLGKARVRGQRHWGQHRRARAYGLLTGLLLAGGLYAYGRPAPGGEAMLPFPGNRIRTQLPVPAYALRDHLGQPVASQDLKGSVTLITGVYAQCSTACPEILSQVKELLASLPSEQRDSLRVVALSLNPEYETEETMRWMAQAYGLPHPTFRYISGDPALMRPVLRDFQFAARRDAATGVIEHANLFILVDAGGRIAFRFNADRRHRAWLREAVLTLLAERTAPAGHLTEPAAL
jgi:protein SCO1